MTTGVGCATDSPTDSPRDGIGDVMSRVRQLDPTSEEVAVRRYGREIAEADALLDSIDLDNVPFLVPFSASWPEGSLR
jgi:hypothetical protein